MCGPLVANTFVFLCVGWWHCLRGIVDGPEGLKKFADRIGTDDLVWAERVCWIGIITAGFAGVVALCLIVAAAVSLARQGA